ncbi:hypothetical protein T07_9747 [Trichinella nelsoni]|uniref:Uncharacterized protein n=1 Tax=Trichinella nelsoni TaxID=6336 RepID=A0A0V0RKQ4_9BILA|nr:hypothetical protein T07_9747 [Trichinella nelsoni]
MEKKEWRQITTAQKLQIITSETVPADVRQMGNLTMEELWTAESTWEPQGQEAASRQEHTALPRRRHVAESRICLATQLLNPCLRKIGERRRVTVNETCSDFI